MIKSIIGIIKAAMGIIKSKIFMIKSNTTLNRIFTIKTDKMGVTV